MNDTGEAQRAKERGHGGYGDPPWLKRPAPSAASVERRWWEEGFALAPAGSETRDPASTANPGSLPPPPPPPPPGLSANTVLRGAMPPASDAARGWSGTISPPAPAAGILATTDTARIERLEQELAAAHEEATALHEMLEDLPEIFERKFRQRLEAILERERLLLADNRLLRQQLYALLPAASEPGASTTPLLPAAPEAATTAPRRLEPLRRLRERLLRKLRTRLGR